MTSELISKMCSAKIGWWSSDLHVHSWTLERFGIAWVPMCYRANHLKYVSTHKMLIMFCLFRLCMTLGSKLTQLLSVTVRFSKHLLSMNCMRIFVDIIMIVQYDEVLSTLSIKPFSYSTRWVNLNHMYAFCRHSYPEWLTVYFTVVIQYIVLLVCVFPGNLTHNLRGGHAMLYQLSYWNTLYMHLVQVLQRDYQSYCTFCLVCLLFTDTIGFIRIFLFVLYIPKVHWTDPVLRRTHKGPLWSLVDEGRNVLVYGLYGTIF